MSTTETQTASGTLSRSGSLSATVSSSESVSGSLSVTASQTATRTTSATASVTATLSGTPSYSMTASASVTATLSLSATHTASYTVSPTLSLSVSESLELLPVFPPLFAAVPCIPHYATLDTNATLSTTQPDGLPIAFHVATLRSLAFDECTRRAADRLCACTPLRLPPYSLCNGPLGVGGEHFIGAQLALSAYLGVPWEEVSFAGYAVREDTLEAVLQDTHSTDTQTRLSSLYGLDTRNTWTTSSDRVWQLVASLSQSPLRISAVTDPKPAVSVLGSLALNNTYLATSVNVETALLCRLYIVTPETGARERPALTALFHSNTTQHSRVGGDFVKRNLLVESLGRDFAALYRVEVGRVTVHLHLDVFAMAKVDVAVDMRALSPEEVRFCASVEVTSVVHSGVVNATNTSTTTALHNATRATFGTSPPHQAQMIPDTPEGFLLHSFLTSATSYNQHTPTAHPGYGYAEVLNPEVQELLTPEGYWEALRTDPLLQWGGRGAAQLEADEVARVHREQRIVSTFFKAPRRIVLCVEVLPTTATTDSALCRTRAASVAFLSELYRMETEVSLSDVFPAAPDTLWYPPPPPLVYATVPGVLVFDSVRLAAQIDTTSLAAALLATARAQEAQQSETMPQSERLQRWDAVKGLPEFGILLEAMLWGVGDHMVEVETAVRASIAEVVGVSVGDVSVRVAVPGLVQLFGDVACMLEGTPEAKTVSVESGNIRVSFQLARNAVSSAAAGRSVLQRRLSELFRTDFLQGAVLTALDTALGVVPSSPNLVTLEWRGDVNSVDATASRQMDVLMGMRASLVLEDVLDGFDIENFKTAYGVYETTAFGAHSNGVVNGSTEVARYFGNALDVTVAETDPPLHTLHLHLHDLHTCGSPTNPLFLASRCSNVPAAPSSLLAVVSVTTEVQSLLLQIASCCAGTTPCNDVSDAVCSRLGIEAWHLQSTPCRVLQGETYCALKGEAEVQGVRDPPYSTAFCAYNVTMSVCAEVVRDVLEEDSDDAFVGSASFFVVLAVLLALVCVVVFCVKRKVCYRKVHTPDESEAALLNPKEDNENRENREPRERSHGDRGDRDDTTQPGSPRGSERTEGALSSNGTPNVWAEVKTKKDHPDDVPEERSEVPPDAMWTSGNPLEWPGQSSFVGFASQEKQSGGVSEGDPSFAVSPSANHYRDGLGARLVGSQYRQREATAGPTVCLVDPSSIEKPPAVWL